jgi:propionyl-CoA carboxylase alpha chain
MGPIRRVLVANRGEIARRVIRGAHDAGCEAVAVFAADDAASPHVGEADAAVRLTGVGLAGTYLDPAALVAAARLAGADAVHPGYGFLSENPALPEACAAAGLLWVGPTPESMRVMGHKTRAKTTVAAAGVPVLPSAVLDAGLSADALAADALAAAAGPVGFPLLVKAAAGGGGRGMRLVTAPGELADAVAASSREAAAAFGSDEVFLERYLASPRHVEVQVIGDQHGLVLHLFDRECSVQRRHQKVVEEAPAVLVGDHVRARMWEAAVAAAASVGYVGVGTVEFLVDGDDFFFLEMNTRLQVEHGVTELVTGLDLVGLQLSVAAGRPLPFAQDGVAVRGHAIEVRLCAERPRQDYQPTPGRATHVRWPDDRTGIRVDRAIESGSTVSPAYDSLVAKVMAHADDRPAAIARLRQALAALELDGLETNRDLLGAIVADPPFGAGQAGIDYLDGRPDLRDARLPDPVRHRHAAAAGFALLDQRAGRSLVPVPAAGWRNIGNALHHDPMTDATGTLDVRVPRPDQAALVRAHPAAAAASHTDAAGWHEVGTAHIAHPADSSDVATVVDLTDAEGLRRRYQVRLEHGHVNVNGPEGQSTFSLRGDDEDADTAGASAAECRAPLPGAVSTVLVTVGQAVSEGDGLLVLEAMKMEHTLRAGGQGTVADIRCEPGQQVDVGDLLVVLEPA